MRISLGAILAICLAGLQFIAIMTVVFSSYLTSEKALLNHAHDLLSDVGTNTIEHSKGFLEPAYVAADLATRLAENRIVASDNREMLEALLFQQLHIAPQFAGIFFGDQNGNFVYVMRTEESGTYRSKIIVRDGDARSTELIWRADDYAIVDQANDPNDNFDPRTRPWFKRASAGWDSIWTDPYIFFSSRQPGITVASPVVNGSGVIQGVIGVDIEISAISSFLAQLSIGQNGVAFILNRNGDVIAHPDAQLIKTMDEDGTLRFASIDELGDPIARSAFAGLAEGGTISVEEETSSKFQHDGKTYVSTLMPAISEDLPWTIAVYAPEDDFIGGIKENRLQNIWIATAITLAAAGIGLLLANRIHKPVRAFAVRAALVSQGEVSASDPLPKTYQELEATNEALVQEIARRRKSEREYGRTFELASRGMAQIMPETGEFIRVNAQFADMLGHSTEDMQKLTIHDVLHPDDANAFPVFAEMAHDDYEYSQDMRYIRSDGKVVWLRVNAIMVRDDQGNPIHAVATMDDVTQRRDTEEKIRDLNRDLSHYARVNVMGQMATGLAHELNQPLTAITQNVDAAISTINETESSDPALVEILSELDQQAHRAGDIIRALRSFVRKDDGAATVFNLDELIQQSLRLIQPEATSNKIDISCSIDDVPSVIAIRIHVAQVLVNLLNNAIEAIAEHAPDRRQITVYAKRAGDFAEISVRDSGPGISPDFDAFAQFETTKTGGMGLGLNISRSIVEDNGGQLWLKDTDDGGACFAFSLKLAQALDDPQEADKPDNSQLTTAHV
ncbi:hypothetical protein GCM10007385_32090 [Tateyamaria omphalii]|uniref:sensor histidine kinase n=1 Tax=Tateyamaria omphalii TaxID=299262 RepID=UPI00167AED8F|nr:sensor histidine kinase [Tateyamaria omphalii]GGX60405.1 hypothetical protein GCM10007385_32090 [Tateyamaria omphalii]